MSSVGQSLSGALSRNVEIQTMQRERRFGLKAPRVLTGAVENGLQSISHIRFESSRNDSRFKLLRLSSTLSRALKGFNLIHRGYPTMLGLVIRNLSAVC